MVFSLAVPKWCFILQHHEIAPSLLSCIVFRLAVPLTVFQEPTYTRSLARKRHQYVDNAVHYNLEYGQMWLYISFWKYVIVHYIVVRM
jgi:hypothetical protein